MGDRGFATYPQYQSAATSALGVWQMGLMGGDILSNICLIMIVL